MVLINNIRKHKFDRQKPTVPYPHQGVAGDRKKSNAVRKWSYGSFLHVH